MSSSLRRRLDMATANAAAFWVALSTARGHEVRTTEEFVAFISGRRIGNRVIMLTPEPSEAAVAAVQRIVAENQGTVVEDPYGGTELQELRHEVKQMPVMVRSPRQLAAEGELNISRVTDIHGLRAVESAVVHGFPLGRVQPYEAREVFPDSLLEYSGFEMFLARAGDDVVGACVTMTAATCTGVYWVTTMPEHRSRGAARQLMAHIMNHHVQRPMTLTASAAGEPLYLSLGFDVVGTSTWWM